MYKYCYLDTVLIDGKNKGFLVNYLQVKGDYTDFSIKNKRGNFIIRKLFKFYNVIYMFKQENIKSYTIITHFNECKLQHVRMVLLEKNIIDKTLHVNEYGLKWYLKNVQHSLDA